MLKNMSKSTLITSIIGGILSVVVLITSIVCLFGEMKSVAGLVILMLAGAAGIAGIVLNIFVNSRLSALALASASIVGFIGYRIATKVVDGLYVTSQAILIIWMICLIGLMVLATINFTNFSKFEETNLLKRLNIISLIICVISIIFMFYVTGILFSNKGLVSGITCIMAILVLIAGKVLSIAFNFDLGKLIIVLVPILLLMATVPYEIGLTDNAGILMFVNYILSFAVVISEFAFLKGNE